MSICVNQSNCAGCTACVSVCPTDAIHMVADTEGFLMPVVEKEKCLDCNLCEKVCPDLFGEKGTTSDNKIAYAFKYRDEDVRKDSSSGAFFPAMARWFVESNGYVCGCVLDNLMPRHIVTNEWEKILQMQGSKYVQSDLNDCFTQICKLLKEKKNVLFTGTSCQVSGLKALVKQKGIDDLGLLCIDFFCHGVPSPKIWCDYIEFYQKEKNKSCANFYFRNKKYGWGKDANGGDFLSYILYERKNGTLKVDDWSYLSRIWRYIFFSDLCIRLYCHNCPYATVNKVSDITMADFWGIEKIDKTFDDGKGTSLVILHTTKGEKFFNQVKNAEIMQVNVYDALSQQRNAFKPSEMNNKREEFWKVYQEKGFEFVLKYYFNYNLKGKVKALIKRILFELRIRYLF